MKLIIAGGREYKFNKEDISKLKAIKEEITEVVSGCARGADRQGEIFAEFFEIPIKKFPANWDKHGKSAGPIRNTEMAKYADALAIFPGGRGSEHMFKEATKRGLRVFDFRN